MKNRILTLTTCVFCLAPQGFAQHVSVQEQTETLKTYKFSDPNPVATPSNLFYPYFRFDGFTAKGEISVSSDTLPPPALLWIIWSDKKMTAV